MQQAVSLKTFFDEYGESMAEKVCRELSVIHDPAIQKEGEVTAILKDLTKRPFPAQAEIVKACYKAMVSGNKAVYMVSEMGTGKTLMSIAVAYVLWKLKKLSRVLVVCPPHLVPKWILEINEAVPNAMIYNLNDKRVLDQLEKIKNSKAHAGLLEFYVIGRERAKTGFIWRPAAVHRNGRYFCPKCGQELMDEDLCPLPLFEKNSQGRFKKKYSCTNRVWKWRYDQATGEHRLTGVICNEPLWQPDNSRTKYRKAIPAKFIKSKMKGFYHLLVVDECHQFKNESGQGYAFGALASACKYILCLTGTLSGGYSSDVYHLLFRTHPGLMIDDNNRWENPKGFIEKYGVLEKVSIVSEEDGLSTKARKRIIVKEKPGISPLLLGRFLLSNAVFLRLSDCMEHLQPYEERVIELGMDPEMADLYNELEQTLKAELLQALHNGDKSLLGGYLHALLSYPERIYKGLQVVHPRKKTVIAEGAALSGIMPKESELVSIIENELSNNRRVLVYIQNSDTTDISPRLLEMMENEGITAKVLKSGDTQNRARIIDNWVKDGIDVLITNPKKVEVGMDLLDFPSIVFYQVPMSTYTLRQASRRSWRIPQTRPVRVYFMTYSGTMQTRLMELMAQKLTTSLAIEGELLENGLAAMSATSDGFATELAKMLVEKSGSSENLKDIWANYRKAEVQAEMMLEGRPVPEIETIQKTEDLITRASTEVARIGNRIVKVQFVEYRGKRKKVTRIEVTQAELDGIMRERGVQVQFTMF